MFCFPVTFSELSSHRSISRKTRLHCGAVVTRSCHFAPLLQFSAHKLKVIKTRTDPLHHSVLTKSSTAAVVTRPLCITVDSFLSSVLS